MIINTTTCRRRKKKLSLWLNRNSKSRTVCFDGCCVLVDIRVVTVVFASLIVLVRILFVIFIFLVFTFTFLFLIKFIVVAVP